MVQQETHIQVESPIDMPLREPFVVRGWATSGSPIDAIECASDPAQWLTLCERPDVRACFPQAQHAVGFQIETNFTAIRDGHLHLRLHSAGKISEHAQRLEPVQLPPARLQIRQVGGDWGREFYASGGEIFQQIDTAVKSGGASLATAPRILDFGCGCGRVLRTFLRFPHTGEVWGADIDAEAIAWNRGHLAHIAKFDCNALMPPLAFPDAFFDVIYSVSVFTHLPEEMQFAWLAELRRVLKPGGVLVASLHGERYWSADPSVKAEVESRGFAYRTGPLTEGLPEFYMSAFHSEAYVRREWTKHFEFVELKPQFLHGVHDAAILRARVS
jgi:SAM-dependent methyltransferase